jgi:hypothetical protein
VLTPLRRPALARFLPERLCPALAALLILAAAGLHLAYLIHGSPLDLAPDEAHYWDWSRHLDWSYYSKGPLVAWLIRGSCELAGAWSERATGSLTLAVRLPAVVCGSLLLASLYLLTVQVLGRPRLGLALVACGLTLPLVAAGSSLMTIDSPYTCCWGWALVFAYRGVSGKSAWAWEATGLCIGLGILAKYTMVLFPASLALFLLTSRAHRRLLISGGFGSMLGITLLCCVPILLWNAQHGWVTFLHVSRLARLASGAEPAVEGGGIRWLGPASYLGGQAALLLVYWFLVWLVAMWAYRPWRQAEAGLRFLWWLSAPVFLFFAGFSLKTGGGEPNWPVTTYLSGGVLGALWLARQFESPSRPYRLATGLALAAALAVGLGLTLAVHHSQAVHPYLEGLAGPVSCDRPYPLRRLDPTCRLRGWKYLAASIDELRDELRWQGEEPVLAGVAWTLPGEMGVYCAGHPQAYSVGLLQGDRHSQYDLWINPIDQPDLFLGRTFLIIGPITQEVESAFDRVEPGCDVVYEEAGRPLSGWTVYVCHGFRGFQGRPAAPRH